MKLTSVRDGLAVFEHPGAGDVVVLLHPGNMDHRCWDEVAANISPADQGPRLVAYDRRGYGASASDRVPDDVEDLRTLIETLEVERVFLAGNSAGGGIAGQFALRWPDVVAGLLLLAPVVPGAPTPDVATLPVRDRHLLELALGEVEPDAAASAELRLWLDGPAANDGRVGGTTRRKTYDLIVAHRRRGGVEEADGPLSDTWDRLSEIKAPVRIVAGGMDLHFVVDNARIMATRIVGAESQTWPDAAHLLTMEHPTRVASKIRDLIATANQKRRPRRDA